MSDPFDPLSLPEYTPGASIALDDETRWPAMTQADRARLDGILDHRNAPPWRHRTGHRLTPAALARARTPLPLDGWLDEHLATARRLPAYRRCGPLERLTDFPLITRDHLVADIAAYVPLDADLDRMVQGSSSGSVGEALLIPDDVEDTARTFWLMVRLLADLGIDWTPDPRRLGLAHIVHQRQAFTYASPLPGFGGAVMARLNLDAREWPPTERDAFLRDTDPQVFSGSPTSLAALLDSAAAPSLHPLALFSGAQHLSAPLRAALESSFGAPVLDLYGLHETRPIAVSSDGGPHRILPTRVVVEVVDAQGNPVPAGTRGELVVTAGANPLLPLVRYRTGDYGALVDIAGRPAISGLEGREDVTFVAADGSALPCVDVTQHLQTCGVRGWTVEQDADGSVHAIACGGDRAEVTRKLTLLFGTPVAVEFVATLTDLGDGKPRRYRRHA